MIVNCIWWWGSNPGSLAIWSTPSFPLFPGPLLFDFLLWIELLWPENPANTYARHTGTLDSSFDLIRSHQQCIPWSPPQEIEPATTDCRAETLQLSQQSTSHTSDAKFVLQWWRSRYTLLMRPDKVETPVQCFRMSCVSFCRIFWSW